MTPAVVNVSGTRREPATNPRDLALLINSREALWAIFERVRAGLVERRFVTWSDIFGHLTGSLAGKGARPYDFAVIDEAQSPSKNIFIHYIAF